MVKTEKEILEKMDELTVKVNNLRNTSNEIGKINFKRYSWMLEALEWVIN